MKLFFRLVLYVRPYWVRLVGALICSVLVAAFHVAYAKLVEPMLDEVFVNNDTTWLILVPVLLIAVTVLKGFSGYGQTYLMAYVGARVVTDIRRQLFQHLLRLPLGFHARTPSSHMLSRVINDVNMVQHSVSGVLKDVFQQSLTFVFLLAYIMSVNWRLALISIVVVPASIYPITQFGIRLRRFATRAQERTADMSLALHETLTGIRIVKSFTREAKEDVRFGSHNEAFFRTWMKSTQVSALASPTLEAVGVIGIAGIIWYGGWQVIQGVMKTGEFFSFLTAAFLMYNPLRRLGAAHISIQQALAAATRVFAVLDAPAETAQDTGTKELTGVRDAIEFRDVSFRYEGVQEPALRGVTLRVRAGEVLALVGSSGAGKTTLVNLIPRFFDPASGAILVDGVDLRDIRRSALRHNIAIVSQETLLFDTTVGENIAYGREGCSSEQIVEAARAAYAHDFVTKLPQGYDTLIGENGVKLSGGERQRIAISRAILRDAPILILDEATSSLDTESERIVQLALSNLMEQRTTFVIAHRLSTVQHADRIAVLERGSVVEVGSHDDLLARESVYKKLYALQFVSGDEGST